VTAPVEADPRRSRLEEQLDQVANDLVELEDQVAAGEIDADTAAALRDTYRAEAAAVRDELAGLAEDPAPGRSPRRMAAGAAILVLGLGTLTLLVTRAVEPRPPGGLVTGGIVTDVAGGETRDLAGVTNEELEAVIEANPDVPAMRMALARRYFAAGEFGDALAHYMVVLETGSPAEALANVGWMAFLSGEDETGLAYVQRALEVDPGYTPALWYLANVLAETGDGAGAVEAVDRLLGSGDVPDEVRAAAEELRATVTGTP
jgi:tetratricopeptide (TPR) repeat protein